MTKLYYVKEGSLVRIKKRKFPLEKDIQTLFEDNLQELMGLTFISGEYAVHDRRFDALAFNEEAHSFVVIEYKRDRNSSLADQGGLYLSLLEENKGDAICEYNEKQNKQLK